MLSLRGEVASFDGDAQALTAGIVLRPFDGVSSRSRPNIVRPQPAPVPSTKPVPVPKPAVVPTPEVQIEKPQRLPIPNNPAPNATPEVLLVGCENPVIGEPVGTDGCARLTGVRRGLQFVGSTAQLTPDSARAVTALADALLSAPNLKVEIRAHAQSGQGPSASQTLSKQRAVAVARALVGAGVQVSRLGARAFGDKEPVVKTGSSAGEMLPNRIEFVVQP